jgi:hypothetical protein
VVKSRGQASLIAFGILAWSAIRFFQALVHGVNKAWGTKDYSWWRLPIKNFAMAGILASALLLGTLAPVLLNYTEYYFWRYSNELPVDFFLVNNAFKLIRRLLPPLVLFYGFCMFFKFAPRRRTTFREIWAAALFVTFRTRSPSAPFPPLHEQRHQFQRALRHLRQRRRAAHVDLSHRLPDHLRRLPRSVTVRDQAQPQRPIRVEPGRVRVMPL